MATFKYDAVTKDGRKVRGNIEAATASEALGLLERQSIFPTAMEKVADASGSRAASSPEPTPASREPAVPAETVPAPFHPAPTQSDGTRPKRIFDNADHQEPAPTTGEGHLVRPQMTYRHEGSERRSSAMTTAQGKAENALARLLTIAGTLLVMGFVHAFAPSVPGISRVVLGPGSLGSWISLILVPAMALVSLGFLRPTKELAIDFLQKNVQRQATLLAVERQVISAVYSFTLILVLMLFYYFARQTLDNPIVSSVSNLRNILDISVAVLGVLALLYLTINMIKLVKHFSASLAKSLIGGEDEEQQK